MNSTIPRSIGAVAAGFILIGLLGYVADTVLQYFEILPVTGTIRFANWQSLLALSYHLIFTLIGAYLTATLAPNRPLNHTLALGVLGILISILGLIAIIAGDLAPAWYGWALILLSLPITWAGGKLFILRQQSKVA
jgi:hypothetical protein